MKKQEKFDEAREEITTQVDATLVKGGGYAEALETISNYLKENDFDDEDKQTLFSVGLTRYRNNREELTQAEHEVVEVKETLEGVYVPVDMFDKDMFDGKYSRYEVCLLAALIYCEMGGESIKGIMYAVSVVLNRVNSPYYPNTIEEVVYQAGQYEPALKGTINKYIDIYYYGNTDMTDEQFEDHEKTFECVLHVLYVGSLLPEWVDCQAPFSQGVVYAVVDGEVFSGAHGVY